MPTTDRLLMVLSPALLWLLVANLCLFRCGNACASEPLQSRTSQEEHRDEPCELPCELLARAIFAERSLSKALAACVPQSIVPQILPPSLSSSLMLAFALATVADSRGDALDPAVGMRRLPLLSRGGAPNAPSLG